MVKGTIAISVGGSDVTREVGLEHEAPLPNLRIGSIRRTFYRKYHDRASMMVESDAQMQERVQGLVNEELVRQHTHTHKNTHTHRRTHTHTHRLRARACSRRDCVCFRWRRRGRLSSRPTSPPLSRHGSGAASEAATPATRAATAAKPAHGNIHTAARRLHRRPLASRRRRR